MSVTRGPRERLLGSAIRLVRERGVEGTGLADLLEHSGTARGSIYQHFPGGKDELIEASTRLAGDLFRGRIAQAIQDDATPTAVISAMVEHSKEILEGSDFAQGCPIVAATASGTRAIQAAAGDVLRGWTVELSDLFVSRGSTRDDADSLASFAISALEGAIVQARAGRTLQPLDDVRRHLAAVIPSPRGAGGASPNPSPDGAGWIIVESCDRGAAHVVSVTTPDGSRTGQECQDAATH